jgi:hypothetical protein
MIVDHLLLSTLVFLLPPTQIVHVRKILVATTVVLHRRQTRDLLERQPWLSKRTPDGTEMDSLIETMGHLFRRILDSQLQLLLTETIVITVIAKTTVADVMTATGVAEEMTMIDEEEMGILIDVERGMNRRGLVLVIC